MYSVLILISLGLDEAQNLRKMEMLTFLHLTEGRNAIDFKLIESEIGVATDDVEQFVIDGKSRRQSDMTCE